MAKSQKRNNREAKKPKQEKPKASASVAVFTTPPGAGRKPSAK